MPDPLSEQLLASYAGMGEAMAVQAFLEAQGIRARAQDLERLPAHAVGSLFGNLGRSAGVWVPAADLARARELLDTFGAPEHAVDEAALEAEALRAASPEPMAPEPPAAPHRRAGGRSGRGAGARLAAAGLLLALLAALLAVHCAGG